MIKIISVEGILEELNCLKKNIEIDFNNEIFRRLAGIETGEISLKDFVGKINKPERPFIEEIGYGSVKLNCKGKNVKITYNGETKEPGSWWYYKGTEILDDNATAFYDAVGDFGRSKDSDGLNIKILGRASGVYGPYKDGKYAAIDNQNNISIKSYQRSTVYTMRSSQITVEGQYLTPLGNPITVGANSYNNTFYTPCYDGFDNDENYTGRYINKNTYSWFEAEGYIRSALAQHVYQHRDYRIGKVLHTDPGLK